MLKTAIHSILSILLIMVLSSCRHQEEVTICFTGDVLLDRGVRQQIRKHNISWLFEDVSSLFMHSDATVINLECPVTENSTPINKKFIFRADPEWLPELKQQGITHAVLANNHSIDQGRSGLQKTVSYLHDSGIIPLGYGQTYPESVRPVRIHTKGVDVFLFSSVLIPLENWVTMESVPSICQFTVEELCKEIEKQRNRYPQSYIIINLHWGVEYQRSPAISQRVEARKLIDAGADAIIGHHPHVIQKEEIYKEKPVFYSLGNFVFDQSTPETCESRIVRFTFTPDSMSWQIHPVTIRQCKPFQQNN